MQGIKLLVWGEDCRTGRQALRNTPKSTATMGTRVHSRGGNMQWVWELEKQPPFVSLLLSDGYLGAKLFFSLSSLFSPSPRLSRVSVSLAAQ